MKYIDKYCRELIFLAISFYSEHFPPFLGITLLSVLPAFLYGCNAPQTLPDPPQETVTKISMEAISSRINDLDIFVFRNDKMQRLDCYQKVEDPLSWNNEIVSSSGERLITVFANSGKTVMDWSGVSSLSYLRDLSISLENESLTNPFMSGLAEVSAGDNMRLETLYIRPMISTVELRSIRCDFTGRPYEGKSLEEAKVYLTNINAECKAMDQSDIMPGRILNAGRLRDEDLSTMSEPGLIAREIGGAIGEKVQHPKIKLICYPNNSISEGPGTPFTRLVIEGKIEGETFYWPLNINKDGEGYGINRNERYIFDITITRKGVKNPDTPVRAEDVDVIFNIEKWNEKEDCEVIF